MHTKFNLISNLFKSQNSYCEAGTWPSCSLTFITDRDLCSILHFAINFLTWVTSTVTQPDPNDYLGYHRSSPCKILMFPLVRLHNYLIMLMDLLSCMKLYTKAVAIITLSAVRLDHLLNLVYIRSQLTMALFGFT